MEKESKKGKRMTVDELAIITKNQFDRVDERFDSLEACFDARFTKMEHTLQTILDVVLEIPSKKSFERLENRVEGIDIRLTSVERKVKTLGK